MSSMEGTGLRLLPSPLLTDFVGRKKYLERLIVTSKRGGMSWGGMGAPAASYYVLVETPFGELFLGVSKRFFNLVEVGDPLVVEYRRGRWTKTLKGKIAH